MEDTFKKCPDCQQFVPSAAARIYHMPGGAYYNRTDIKPEEGDRWFCTEAEAQAAGFRRAQR